MWNWPKDILYYITEAELMCEAALEALVLHLKTCTLWQGTRHVRCATQRQSRRRGEKSLLLGAGKKKRRKRANSASVIWYTVLFRQNRTDRPRGDASAEHSLASRKCTIAENHRYSPIERAKRLLSKEIHEICPHLVHFFLCFATNTRVDESDDALAWDLLKRMTWRQMSESLLSKW